MKAEIEAAVEIQLNTVNRVKKEVGTEIDVEIEIERGIEAGAKQSRRGISRDSRKL